MSTLTVLQGELRTAIGNPTTADVSDINLATHINSAYSDISRKFKWIEVVTNATFATVVGTADYAVPGSINTIMKVRDDTNTRRLLRRYLRYIAALGTQSNGQPIRYARLDATQIRLSPPPAGVYTIRVWGIAPVAALSAGGDTPLLPTEWHIGIRLLAKYNYHRDQSGDIPKATSGLNDYREWMRDMPTPQEIETEEIDVGVELPTLAGDDGTTRQDFDVAVL